MTTTASYETWYKESIGLKAVENLRKNSFDAIYFSNAADASKYICSMINSDMSVAFGGSMTVRQLKINEYAKAIGAKVFDHNAPGLTSYEKLSVMRSELTADLFISSTNALTIDGCLVNADGYGNRVAAMIFGPQKVLIVAGTNKITANEEDAFNRIKFVAGPMNMKRLNRNTPCTSTGTCSNCSSEQRGCRAYTVLRKRPSLTPVEVVIIGENLGM